MSDRTKSKKRKAPIRAASREAPKAPSREQAKVLRARYGVEVDRGIWDESQPAPAEAEPGWVCAFCGTTEGQFREIFDGKHDVIICRDCLEASEESGADRIQ